jgi:rhamnulokinase
VTSKTTFLAFDIGAESGRAFVGRIQFGFLSVEEIHRFPNEPVMYNGELHWDAPKLWLEILKALERVGSLEGIRLEGIGVDTWGIDYALLGETGALLENPYHYRDSRTRGMMELAFARVTPNEIYMHTGIEFMPINTLYQLYAASLKTPRLLEAAERLVTISGLFNYWLTGSAVCEFTSATTTQFYAPRKQNWSTEILEKLDLPTRILTPIVQPGTIIGPLLPRVAKPAGVQEVPVVAPACHDTGSAVAAIASTVEWAFISCGTWSLFGTEVPQPVINPEAQRLNFTNEGGVDGTFRLQKNITGLWLLQCCRRDWQLQGREFTYGELTEMARSSAPFQSFVDPDDPSFLHPEDMPQAIARFCTSKGQRVPADPPAVTRALLESLAFKYRSVLDSLEYLTGKTYEEIHIVGGGARNELLNQFTAEATGRRVIAGPIEATALGNIGMQLLATGAATSLAEVRQVIARSFPTQAYEPTEHEKWVEMYPAFSQICARTSP